MLEKVISYSSSAKILTDKASTQCLVENGGEGKSLDSVWISVVLG